MPRPKLQTCKKWINDFHADFMQRGSTEATWLCDYWKVLKHLPADEPLTAKLLHALVLNTEVNTKTRNRTVTTVARFAQFAKIDYDPKPYKGKYSTNNPTKVRNLPDDLTIVKHYCAIQNPGYQWIFAMMATYGLRNHECFRLDFDALRRGQQIVEVQNETKTGAREVWPFHPEWFDEFNLSAVTLPDVDLTRSNDSLGRSISAYFSRRYPLPFLPYDLRHRWAVRTVEYGLQDSLSARQMGHSLEVHNRIYQKWISRIVQQRAYDAITGKNTRQKAPLISDIPTEENPE
jgi:hypothetical protein